MKTIHEILSDPDSLSKLSTTELSNLLAPFIPAARKAVLPEERPVKTGMAIKTMAEMFKNPKFLAEIDAFKKAKEQKK